MIEVLLCLILLLAAFIHGLTGFGFGLVSVPLLQIVIGVRATPPLVTLISAFAIVILACRYRHTLKLGAVLRLALASTLIVPVGVYGSQHLDEPLLALLVGMLLIGYSCYALLNLRLPQLQSPGWAYLFGSCSGFLAGMANIGGPPLMLYGHLCGWAPETFKSNLQGVFLLNVAVVVISHGLQGNFTPEIWSWFCLSLPAAALGLGAGIWVSGRLDPQTFRNMVLVLLIGLGIQLVIRAMGGHT